MVVKIKKPGKLEFVDVADRLKGENIHKLNVFIPKSGRHVKGECVFSVWSNERFPMNHQCSRKVTIEEKGWGWCFQHSPSVVKKRKEDQDAEYKAKSKARDLKWDRKNAWNDIAAVAVKLLKQEATHEDLERAVSKWEKLGDSGE